MKGSTAARRKVSHGDVYLVPVDVVPKGAKKLKHCILAEGEVTGHCHAVVGDGVELFEKDGVLYCSAPNGAVVTHEEHKTIEVPNGISRVGIQREVDPFEQEIRNVAD